MIDCVTLSSTHVVGVGGLVTGALVGDAACLTAQLAQGLVLGAANGGTEGHSPVQ